MFGTHPASDKGRFSPGSLGFNLESDYISLGFESEALGFLTLVSTHKHLLKWIIRQLNLTCSSLNAVDGAPLWVNPHSDLFLLFHFQHVVLYVFLFPVVNMKNCK